MADQPETSPDARTKPATAKQNGQQEPAAPAAAPEKDIAPRKLQYMFAARRGANLLPMAAGIEPAFDAQQVLEALQRMPEVTIVRRIRPSSFSVLSAGPSASQDIIVATTTPEHGQFLERIAHPGMIVERDLLLKHLSDLPTATAQRVTPARVVAASIDVKFHVQDGAGQPVPEAQICVYTGNGGEAQAATDASGNATATVYGGYLNDVVALYVKPHADLWERFVSRPALSADQPNVIVLKRLGEFAAVQFPANPFLGWGQRLMGLSGENGGALTGRGAKIAIIDSGCDNSHAALTHVKLGRDYTNLSASGEPNEQSWTLDALGHGTHCAGVITGNGQNGQIRGFCPEAEIHVLKLFPGGAFNNLAAAIHYCIDNQIDVANCSLGSDATSEIIQQLIQTAREAGVARVVAAGNSSGPVQFPAAVPGVLCVSAVGQQGEYPADTYHAQTAEPGTILVNGLFPAKFSCRGSEVKVCAPGVAIISTMPGGGYASWDGTSMAAPAITGSAGLVVAHHPDFANRQGPRNAARVDRIFQIVMGAAVPLGLDPTLGGVGLPAVPHALLAQASNAVSTDVFDPNEAGLQAAVRQGLSAGLAAFGLA